MGMTVYEFSGSTGFVLFTGLSILPSSLSLGDCITRGIAALYLRVRSKGFRDWVGRIEGAHLLTWLMRGTLLACAIRGASGGWIDGIGFVFGALFMASVLRWAESDANVNKVKNAWREGKTQLSHLLKA